MSKKASGILKRLQRGNGFLRDPALSFQPGSQDVWVPANLIKEYGLVDGAEITGDIHSDNKGIRLTTIESICGLPPQQFHDRKRFEHLPAINPHERIRLGDSKIVTMRIIDLIAPIAKGTRGLIVSPPKSGKTQILEDIAHAIHTVEPEQRIIILLIDERPEEVTHFRRNVQAEVLASSSDQSIESHINLAELAMAHIRCELECGRDIIVLIDSITRMARAFNIYSNGIKRTMSGGLDAKALEIPRRFFGLARNIENGGSVTVIATAQVETGSRMDDFIFEEFKSTGNSEIVLDRSLAEARIFPAINLLASGTRREELLYDKDEILQMAALRRWLINYEPKAAMRALLELVNKDASNKKLLQRFKPNTVKS